MKTSGNHELGGVKPECSTRDEHPIQWGTHEVGTAGAHEVRLEPSGVQAQGSAEDEERNQWQELAHRQPRPFPPGDYQQDPGKRAYGALAESGENEETERQSVPFPAERVWLFRMILSIQRFEVQIEPERG